MNSTRQLLKRLLGLFPIKVVKENFNETGNAPDVIEAVSGNNSQLAIKNFSRENFYYTKQHIYLRQLDRKYRTSQFNSDELPYTVFHKDEEDDFDVYFLLPKVRYEVVVGGDEYSSEEIDFYQPVLIRISSYTVMYHITILEKNISHYFGNRPVLKTDKLLEESAIVQQLDSFFHNYFGIEQLDLNAGIKTLWDNDWIDSKHVKWRKNRSLSTETMDENYTVKEQYPDYYNEIIQGPLQKTVFKYLREDSNFPEHFAVDPGRGVVYIPLFPLNEQQVKNVIREILRNN